MARQVAGNRFLLPFLALLAVLWTSAARAEPVDLELVLATDTSVSVDDHEYRLQMRGIARAFRRAEIIDIIYAMPNGMAVTLVHWSVGHLNGQAVPWRRLKSHESVLAFADAVERAGRGNTGRSTAIGDAIGYSLRLIETNRFEGGSRKIDISGDARSNSGPDPSHFRNRAISMKVTVNGLAISGGDRGLFSYYRDRVIGGPSAFVMAVGGFEDFESAIYRKLLKELAVSALVPAGNNRLE